MSAHESHWTRVRVRCANRYLLGSYSLFAASATFAVGSFRSDSLLEQTLLIGGSVLTGFSGGILGVLTSFGDETLAAYRRASEHIAKHSSIESRFTEKYHDYCVLVGARLAAKDAGLPWPDDAGKGTSRDTGTI